MLVPTKPSFTPELLISTPRYSPATPNDEGTHALYTVSTYSIETGTDVTEVKVLDVRTGHSTLFSDSDQVEAPQWLVARKVLWLQRVAGRDQTNLWIGTAGEDEKRAYVAGSVASASVANVKTKTLPDGSIALAFTALANPDGTMFDSATEAKPASSAREYETAFVCYYDKYYTLQRSTLWYTVLERDAVSRRYKLSACQPVNSLKGTGIEFPSIPQNPFILGGSYDVSANGILLTAPNPRQPIRERADDLYYLLVPSFAEPAASRWRRIRVPGWTGASSAVQFSPDGNAAAFFKQEDCRADVWATFFVIRSIKDLDEPIKVTLFADESQAEVWNVCPGSFIWSNDSNTLYFTADHDARIRLYSIPLHLSTTTGQISAVPTLLSQDGSVSSMYCLGKAATDTHLFINKSTMLDSCVFALMNTSTKQLLPLFSATKGGATLGLRSSQLSEIRFRGHGGKYDCHAWVLRPSNFNEEHKYPVVFLFHGGPESSFTDSWSARANLPLYAEQGYIVVAVNPTGSTGFGRAFTVDVRGDYGGRPYGDIVNCFEHVKRTMPCADMSRVAAIGASYGGYMINWIAGQPLAKELRALVCHDGVFSAYGMLGCDVGCDVAETMRWLPWEDQEVWDRNDPARFTQNWSTPMLIIHSSGDYRCPIPDGLAAYNVCQLRGIPSRFLNFPDEGHIVVKPANSLHWYRTVIGWINKFTGTDGIKLAPPVTEPPAIE